MYRQSVLVLSITALLSVTIASFGTAKGTMTFPGKDKPITTTFNHAFFIKGPDAADPRRLIRRVLFTATDIGAKLQACETMSCVDDAFTEGLQVDWDAGSRLNYWLTLNGQLVQFSGSLEPSAFTTRESTSKRIAGKLAFDDTATSGPKVMVEFDAPVLRELTRTR